MVRTLLLTTQLPGEVDIPPLTDDIVQDAWFVRVIEDGKAIMIFDEFRIYPNNYLNTSTTFSIID